MSRKLAHIEIIEWIKPIEGADMIELCGILGWQCIIAKKDGFKVGDKVVYCEVDSILPELPQFEFLRKRKFRIKTLKMKGQISQGLVLPLNILPEINSEVSIGFLNIGDDVTNYMGITKYLSPSERAELTKQENKKHWTKDNKLTAWLWKYKWFRQLVVPIKSKVPWPQHVTKTDEERIQNCPEVLRDFADKEIYVTEKIDYQSVTFTSQLTPRFNGSLGKRLFNWVTKL